MGKPKNKNKSSSKNSELDALLGDLKIQQDKQVQEQINNPTVVENDSIQALTHIYSDVPQLLQEYKAKNMPLIQREFKQTQIRKLGDWKPLSEVKFVNDVTPVYNQTEIPSIPVHEQYPGHVYPIVKEIEYSDTTARKNQEKLAMDANSHIDINDARRAAEVHRQTRRYIQEKVIKPGVDLNDLCNEIERSNKMMLNAEGLKGGFAFPTGVSLNECAAHYSTNPGDVVVLKYDDVLKIDYGTHINGRIIDSAFTVAFNPIYDNLLEGVREATYEGMKTAGIDVRLGDVGAAVTEVMTSYEVELGGKTYTIKPIKNLNGHSIDRYKVHGGKCVPFYDNKDQTKMVENEFYAIETFGSIRGKGQVWDAPNTSHYMLDFDYVDKGIRNPNAKKLYGKIKENFGTLAFCRRWLEQIGEVKHRPALKNLCDLGCVNAYPPLNDADNSYVAQYEHTFVLRPTCKEYLSWGDDY